MLDLADRMERREWLLLLRFERTGCDNIAPHRLRLRALLPPNSPVSELMEPAFRVMHSRKAPRREAGLELLQVHRAVHLMDQGFGSTVPSMSWPSSEATP